MSTRSTTHFIGFGETRAIIYRHSDGYPEGAGDDIVRFMDDVEEQTADTRFGDATYLAAKYVVFLADMFRDHYTGDPEKRSNLLDFLSVGVCMRDPGDIEFRYEVDCDNQGDDGRPAVQCFSVHGGRYVDIPAVEARKRGVR